jgi:hypothetical protein
MTTFDLCEAFERFVARHVTDLKPAHRSGFIVLHYDENAAVLDRWHIAQGDRYHTDITRGPNLAAALGIEEPEAAE